jgi:Lipocalin-like domain
VKRPVVAALAVFCAGLGLAAGGAAAQTVKDLVGAWTIVSMTVEGEGKKSEPFGPNPIGTQIYDSSGRFASILMRSDLPKVASNNRATSTPEESQKIAAHPLRRNKQITSTVRAIALACVCTQPLGVPSATVAQCQPRCASEVTSHRFLARALQDDR